MSSNLHLSPGSRHRLPTSNSLSQSPQQTDTRFQAAAAGPSNSTPNAAASPAPSRLPNYNATRVQEALEHLACIDLIELCNEAKVERCRATRDLSSCGRYVESVLNSCGHASLCTECCQRCDICPICRIPIPKNGNRLHLRLYYECIEAGLISKKCDDRFQEKEDREKQISADIERLYSLFDVAMENNLVSLISHCIHTPISCRGNLFSSTEGPTDVTDVCMDESAVSSDPVIAFLLDEVVVKDWCRRTFKNILAELQDLCILMPISQAYCLYNNNLTVQQMKTKLSSLLRFSVKLVGISNVLEVLESSFKGTLSAQLHDLHHLQESILMTKQHMDIMIWLIRHNFLENVGSRYTNFAAWRSSVRERKSAASTRAWPESVNHSADSTKTNVSTLFIEDALSNIEIEREHADEMGGELEIASLQKDGSSLFFRSKIEEGMAGCYPFESLRAAADVLFLHGTSDLVVAKQAIVSFFIYCIGASADFLYYLFDRQWTRPEMEWRYIIDDFAASFNLTRHSLVESFSFYLLDDHTDDALQEACRLLPEISGPTTHPKVAQVLLERQNPDAALMVLRWCGRDGGAQLVSLAEAVTAVRVRVECGLLTEAFMYQRTLCMKLKEKMLKPVSSQQSSNVFIDESRTWAEWVEALVTEICILCIRRNLVERMIELPWNSLEEKYLHKSLLDFAVDDPSTTIGSLLVVFYLQAMLGHYWMYVKAYPRLLQKQARVDRDDLEMDVEHQTLELRKMNNCACNQLWSEFNTEMFVLHPRYRYVEAYQVDRKLQSVEQDFIANNSVGEEVLFRMKSASHWRAGLVEKGLELLLEVQRQEAKTGKLLDNVVSPANEVEIPAIPGLAKLQPPIPTSLLVPTSVDSSLFSRKNETITSSKPSILETPSKPGEFASNSHLNLGNHGSPSIPHGSFFRDSERVPKPQSGVNKKFKFDDIRTPGIHRVSPMRATPLKEFNRSVPQNRGFEDHQLDEEVSPQKEENGFVPRFKSTRPYSLGVGADPVTSSSGSSLLLKEPSRDSYLNSAGKRVPSNGPHTPWKIVPSDDPMDVSLSNGEKAFIEERNANGGPRWRSDDTSEDELETPDRLTGPASYSKPTRGVRRSRLARR
ncbi:hypothetical protein C3L33_08706, partial [Rhododendron williamsianum]